MARPPLSRWLFVCPRQIASKVWVARWREDVIRPDGVIARMMRSQVLGSVSSIPTRREARNSSARCYGLPTMVFGSRNQL